MPKSILKIEKNTVFKRPPPKVVCGAPEANKLIAQAHAEVRRAAAVALEQEMQARVQEMRARVVEAEAQVPQAMAEAFRQGNLGIMDYYKMKNIQADTGMREGIAGGSSTPPKG